MKSNGFSLLSRFKSSKYVTRDFNQRSHTKGIIDIARKAPTVKEPFVEFGDITLPNSSIRFHYHQRLETFVTHLKILDLKNFNLLLMMILIT